MPRSRSGRGLSLAMKRTHFLPIRPNNFTCPRMGHCPPCRAKTNLEIKQLKQTYSGIATTFLPGIGMRTNMQTNGKHTDAEVPRLDSRDARFESGSRRQEAGPRHHLFLCRGVIAGSLLLPSSESQAHRRGTGYNVVQDIGVISMLLTCIHPAFCRR